MASHTGQILGRGNEQIMGLIKLSLEVAYGWSCMRHSEESKPSENQWPLIQENGLNSEVRLNIKLANTGTAVTESYVAALVEALMGFQFNHVGGGTKTRRPITLHMKYNSACVQPTCYLLTEDFGEQEVSLEELQV